MAALVLGAVGGYMFGPVGFMAGSLLGNLLFPQKQEGPRLQNLKLQDSSYGQMIPIAYGTIRLAGQVVWQTDLQPHKHSSGGKGGPNVTTYTYTASFAVKVCKGPIDHIAKIWANSEVIYDITGDTPNLNQDLPITIYTGVEEAIPDPTMEAILGVGNVPAFRDDAAVVWTDWDLGNWGNAIPSLTFQVVTVGGQPSPIAIKAAYHDEPHDYLGTQERWQFRWVGGAVGQLHCVVSHWKLDGSDIRVQAEDATSPPLLYTYANPSLIANGEEATDDATRPPITTSGATGWYWRSVGYWRYSDNVTVRPVWLMDNAGIGILPVLLAADGVGFSGSTPTATTDLQAELGIPGYVITCTMSQDGKRLFIFTLGPGGGTGDAKWYEAKDGAVTRSGTTSSVPSWLSGSLQNEQIRGTLGVSSAYNEDWNSAVSVFENNGEWCWAFKGGDPNHEVALFHLDSNTLIFSYYAPGGSIGAQDPGYSRTGLPNHSGGFFGAICIPAEGYAGLVVGISLILFTRFSGEGQILLKDIVSDISARCQLAPSDIDDSTLLDVVNGYVISSQADARTDIDQLRTAYFFDATERNGQAVFVKRGGLPVITIPDDDLAAQAINDTPPPLIEVVRTQEIELPVAVNVSYLNSDAAYQIGSQQAIWQTVLAKSVSSVQLAIAMIDIKARQIATVLLREAWIERDATKILLTRKYAYLEPTDVIAAHGYTMRVDKKTHKTGGLIELEGKKNIPAIYVVSLPANAGSGGQQSGTTAPQATNLLLLDLPVLKDTDFAPGVYVAMAGVLDDTWTGATLYESSDGGQNYAQIGSSNVATTMGTTSNALGNYFGGDLVDEINQLTVVIGPGGGTLSSVDLLTMLNGANLALVGSEVVQFRDATLTAPNTYVLAGLLRGRRGTEFEMSRHQPGDVFVFLPTTLNLAVSFGELGQTRLFKAVSNGQTLGITNQVSFTNWGAALRCYSPVLLNGAPNTSNDIVINWVRRTRIGGEMVDFTDIPVSEASESYVLQVWDATFTICARVVTGIISPTFLYTSAMQVADFGANQQTVYISVGQLGSFGLGTQAHTAIAGAGGSVNAPLNPVAPYNSGQPPVPPVTGCSGTVINDIFTWSAFSTKAGPVPFNNSMTWVVKIPVPASPNPGGLNISIVPNQPATGFESPVAMTLSTSPCGPPLLPTVKLVSNQWAISFGARIGPNPTPQTQPTLMPNTDYYISITASGAVTLTAQLVTQG